MSDKQILEHFKESFPLKISQLLEIVDTEEAIGKTQVLVLLFKSKLPQDTTSSMLVDINQRRDKIRCTKDANNRKHPNTFHETFCKSGIEQERLIRVTSKTDQNKNVTAIAKPSPLQ